MLPSETLAATAAEAPTAHVPMPKSKECFNRTAATVIDIPSTKVSAAEATVAGVANRPRSAISAAAVVLSAATHPAHLYAPEPTLLPVASVLGGGGGGGGGSGGCVAAAQLTDMQRNKHDELNAASALQKKNVAANCQRCCPPPMFIILISLLEIGVFVYDYMTVAPQTELSSTSIPSESSLIYRPDRRLQVWRFVSYMVLHANWFHLGFNVVVQLLYGLPLELVHGSLRIAVIYLAGVFAGSLGTSVVDSEVYLVGASGGVYALLAAQLANLLLNFTQMRYGISQLVSVVIFVSCDLGYALYSRYFAVASKVTPSVSYVAHVTGSLAGFTMGLLVLKQFDSRKAQSHLLWWLALSVYLAFTIFAIVFNLINTVTAQILEQEGEVIKQHLLHDLGIS